MTPAASVELLRSPAIVVVGTLQTVADRIDLATTNP